MHFLGPSVVSSVVRLLGVNLYPVLSSLLSFLCFFVWCALAYGAGCVGWFLPLWCVRPRVGLAVGSVRACFLLLVVALFLSFCWSVWSFLFHRFRWFCLFVLFSLLSCWPRAALPWGVLGSWKPHIDVTNSEECILAL